VNFKHLGRSGLRVSRLCLGTMNFGMTTDEPTAFEIMDRAVDMGINFFDTADVYGGPSPRTWRRATVSRRRSSAAGSRRAAAGVTGSSWRPRSISRWTGPNDRRLSAYHIRRACDDSLRRLQTDHIDLYQMHHVDRSTPWEEVWQAMDQPVREGKVTYIGHAQPAAARAADQTGAHDRDRAHLPARPLLPPAHARRRAHHDHPTRFAVPRLDPAVRPLVRRARHGGDARRGQHSLRGCCILSPGRSAGERLRSRRAAALVYEFRGRQDSPSDARILDVGIGSRWEVRG
jgi:Aldo/keto reductase family